MGDHRAGSTGSTATSIAAPSAPTPGRRVARSVADDAPDDAPDGQGSSQPYVGRRVATIAPATVDATRGAETLPYVGRRVAGRDRVMPRREPIAPGGRRIAIDPELAGVAGLAGDADDVVGHLLRPTAVPTPDSYVGRRMALPVELITEPTVVRPVPTSRRTEPLHKPLQEPGPATDGPVTPPVMTPAIELILLAPALETPPVEELVVDEPVVHAPVPEKPAVDELVQQLLDHVASEEPLVDVSLVEEPELVIEAAELVDPVLVAHPELAVEPPTPVDDRVTPKRARPGGRRVASRRPRVPSLPLLAGVAVLAISAGGALQATHPGLAGANADGRIFPASALSGSSAVGSANVLGDRGTSVSRDSSRLASSDSLQAAADAQAKARDAALSQFAAQAQKQAAQIKLHQWVLPVTPGVYHLTARFGDYSSLWSHFHTGLDFAAPTGTPIMAVAGGTITDVGYSGAYGNRTVETLPDGTELWYCHQNSFGTSVGATVKPGQVIGYIGSTGNVTGPHLHLEVHPGGGDPVDPYTALVVHGLQP